jgi:short-subunit dehydrogenase
MNIDGKTALVTGATGGLGIAIARELHAAGARLVLTGRRREVLEELAAEVEGKFFVCDLADRAQLEELARSHGDVDILINNAGLPGTGFFLDFEMDRIDRILDVNLRAAIYLTRVAAQKMAERRSGHVVFISSVAGLIGSPRGSIYSATKFGLRAWNRSFHDIAGFRQRSRNVR